MSALLKPIYYSLEEYYGLEKASDRRWEYWDGEILCMSGGTKEHGILSGRLHGLLFNLFDKKGCVTFTGEQAILANITASGYVYPNTSVYFGCVQPCVQKTSRAWYRPAY